MRHTVRLTAANPSRSVNLDNFRASSVFVENPTGSVVLVRLGGNDIPTTTTADHRIPANSYLLIPAEGASFGVALADPSAVASPQSSNLLTTATVVFLSPGEVPPSFGAASFLSLSLADQQPQTAFSGAATGSVIDLGAWGGAIVSVVPSAAGGQGILTVEIGSDGTSWATLGSWAFWPGVPVLLNVPRIARFMRASIAATGITAEPAPSGTFGVRTTIAEITALKYIPSTTRFTKVINIASGGPFGQFTLATVGIPTINFGIAEDTGINFSMRIETSPIAVSPTGPRRYVFYRDQKLDGIFSNFSRSIGNLDRFVVFTAFNTSATALQLTIDLAIPDQSDATTPLENLYRAIGDSGQTPDVNTINLYTMLNAIYLGMTGVPNIVAATTVTGGAGVWASTGITLAGTSYVEQIVAGANLAGTLIVGYGNAGAPIAGLYSVLVPAGGMGPVIRYDGKRLAGYPLVNPNSTIWVNHSAAAATVITSLIAG